MSPSSQRYLMALCLLLSFFAYRMLEHQLGEKKPLFPRCKRYEQQSLLKDFTHEAESCTLESFQPTGEDRPQSAFIKISCSVEDLPYGYERRLKPHEYGRSLLLNERIPKPTKTQWTFEVPKDAVQGLNELI